MTLEVNTRIKITSVQETNNDNLMRTLSCDQEPYPEKIYTVENNNSNEYTLSLNNRTMRFTLYSKNDKWYYITHDRITRQTTHVWDPKECTIEVV